MRTALLIMKRMRICTLLLCIYLFLTVNAYAFYGAKFEPRDGEIYHGAQGEVRPVGVFKRHVDWDGIDEYTHACGNRPKLVMHYISFDPLAFWLLRSPLRKITKQPYDYIPQIGLDFYSFFPSLDISKPHDITEGIARGDYDKRIRKLALLFADMKTPVFLRPGYEFGGNGQGQHASKEYWVQAWRRIFDIFKEEKVTNVAFVWDTLDAKDYMDFYPGDDYVDWWGINVFCNNADQDPFIARFVQEAAKHKKPVMIAESTPRDVGTMKGEEAWGKWYKPYFNLIAKYSHIKAFCYINASWTDFPGESFKYDCRIQKNDVISSRYHESVSKKGFIHAQNK